ncbi:MAG TPA: type I-U CRISPR-associated protein Csb2 [Actinomycetota bacterium]
MIAITVELLHGTIRAASAGDLALTDQEDPGDWPPSPARLFSALVAADGTRDRCRVTDGSELRAIADAAPPSVFASARSDVLCTALNPRFVVVDSKTKGAVQDYPARGSALVSPGTRLSPRSAIATYVWDELDATDALVRALEMRAARVGYFGCSDSPARVRVHTSVSEADVGPEWRPDTNGAHEIPVPFPEMVGILDTMFDAFSRGQPVRRSWYPVKHVRYRAPDELSERAELPWSEVLWMHLRPAVPGRFLLRVTEALKAAVLKLHETHVGPVPRALHGHGFEAETGYRLVHWLGLPEVGHQYARGRLHGLAVAVPEGVDPEIINDIREAASHLKELTIAGRAPVAVAPFAGEEKPWTARPDRWSRRSRRWVATSPVVHERRVKGEITIDDVTRWCSNAGIPAAVRGFRLSPVPLAHGALALRPHEVFHSKRSRRPFSHLEVIFDEEVEGPVVLGRARQFGIGLMAPVVEGR